MKLIEYKMYQVKELQKGKWEKKNVKTFALQLYIQTLAIAKGSQVGTFYLSHILVNY